MVLTSQEYGEFQYNGLRGLVYPRQVLYCQISLVECALVIPSHNKVVEGIYGLSRTYVCEYVRTYVRSFVRMFTRSSDLIYYPISI